MSECEKLNTVQDIIVPVPTDSMGIDTAPPAAEEKSAEQHKPKPKLQAGNGNATGASPKEKKRSRASRGKAENTKPKAQAIPKTPRKPPAKRAKKSNPTIEDNPPARSTPTPPDSPKQTLPKQAASRHTGRQHAGSYTQEEVRALQTWVNNSIRDDWNTIAQEVGKATGVYRCLDNLRNFYGTVVLRQMYDSFPDKNGKHGTIIAVDVGVGDGSDGGEVGKMCGNCGAILIEGTKDEVKEKIVTEKAEELRPIGEPMQMEAELTGGANSLVDNKPLVEC